MLAGSIVIHAGVMTTDLPRQGLAKGMVRNVGMGTAEQEVPADPGQSIRTEEE